VSGAANHIANPDAAIPGITTHRTAELLEVLPLLDVDFELLEEGEFGAPLEPLNSRGLRCLRHRHGQHYEGSASLACGARRASERSA
jgi:hypothetical protein